MEIQQGKHNVENPEDKSPKYKISSLKHNITQWRTIVDAMSEAVFLINLEHKILLCNKAALEFLGKSDFNEIIGHKCWELVHGTTQQVDWCPVIKMRVSGNREAYIRNLNGKWVEISVNPVYDDIHGQLIGAVHIIIDITVKKQAEDALRESEQHYLTILNSLNDPMHVMNKDFRIIFKNPAMTKWLNQLKIDPDIVGKTINEALPLLNYEKVYDEYEKVFKTGELLVSGGKIEIFTRDIFTETLKVPIISEGEVNQIVTIVKDMNEQKESEQKLKESEQKYRVLFDSSPFAVGLVDMTGKIIDVNRVHEIGAGYSKKDLIGKPFTELSVIHEKYLPIVAKEFKNLIKNGISEPQEIQVYNKDGSLIWIYLYASLIKLGNKAVIQVISQNITNIKEVEVKLKESMEKYRILFETSPNSILLVDLNGMILDCNPSTESTFGYKRDDLIGKKFSELGIYNQEDLNNLIKSFSDKINGKDVHSIEIQIKKKNNELSWVNVQSSLIKSGDQTLIQGIIRDITEKKEAGQELIKLSKIKGYGSQSFPNNNQAVFTEIHMNIKIASDMMKYQLPAHFVRESAAFCPKVLGNFVIGCSKSRKSISISFLFIILYNKI